MKKHSQTKLPIQLTYCIFYSYNKKEKENAIKNFGWREEEQQGNVVHAQREEKPPAGKTGTRAGWSLFMFPGSDDREMKHRAASASEGRGGPDFLAQMTNF